MYFDDLYPGMTLTTAPAVIDKDKMLAFAREYDNNPLHIDEEYAKTTVFGGIIASGLMSFMAVWPKFLEITPFGSELIAGKSAKIEWLKPVFAGDVLTGNCTISRLERRNERNGLAEMVMDIYNQNGVRVMTSLSEFIIKCRPQSV